MTANLNLNTNWMHSEDAFSKRTAASLGYRPEFINPHASVSQTSITDDESNQSPYKYSREFMLSLFHPHARVPIDFERHEHVSVEECQGPLAFVELSESEKKILAGPVHSEPSRRMPNTNNNGNAAADKSSGSYRHKRDLYASPIHSPVSEQPPVTPGRAQMRPKGRSEDYFTKRSGDGDGNRRREASSDLDGHTLWNGQNDPNAAYTNYAGNHPGSAIRPHMATRNGSGARNTLNHPVGLGNYGFQELGISPSLANSIGPNGAKWYYRDNMGKIQGPFEALQMRNWYKAGYFPPDLPVRRDGDAHYELLAQSALAARDVPVEGYPPLHTPVLEPDMLASPDLYQQSGPGHLNMFAARDRIATRGPLASPSHRYDVVSSPSELFSPPASMALRSPMPQGSIPFSSMFGRDHGEVPESPSWVGNLPPNGMYGAPQPNPSMNGLQSPMFDYVNRDSYEPPLMHQNPALFHRSGWNSAPTTPALADMFHPSSQAMSHLPAQTLDSIPMVSTMPEPILAAPVSVEEESINAMAMAVADMTLGNAKSNDKKADEPKPKAKSFLAIQEEELKLREAREPEPTVKSEPVASPWSKDTTVPRPSLRDIQEQEAREAKVKKEAETRLLSEARATEEKAQSTWNKPSATSSAPWAAMAAPKKTLREIQLEEEEASKQQVKASATLVAANSSAPVATGYAGVAKVNRPEQSGWKVVTHGRNKTAADVASSSVATATTTGSTVPVQQTISTPTHHTKTSSNRTPAQKSSSEQRKEPSEAFCRWCRQSLRDLNAGVNADDLVQMLLPLPLEDSSKELVQDIIYASSSSMDGRWFAEEFMKHKRADLAGKLTAVDVSEKKDEDTFTVVTKRGRRKQQQQ